MAEARQRVLFLCTHNAARSQMAEGILHHLSRGAVEAYSAGSEPSGVHPLAVRALAEMGMDTSGQRSKHLDDFAGERLDYVITLCDSAREVCPVFPGDPHRIHWSFNDPAALQGSEKDRYDAFKRTASELATRIRFLLLVMERSAKPSRA